MIRRNQLVLGKQKKEKKKKMKKITFEAESHRSSW